MELPHFDWIESDPSDETPPMGCEHSLRWDSKTDSIKPIGEDDDSPKKE